MQQCQKPPDFIFTLTVELVVWPLLTALLFRSLHIFTVLLRAAHQGRQIDR
jgi:hypothetical protein